MVEFSYILTKSLFIPHKRHTISYNKIYPKNLVRVFVNVIFLHLFNGKIHTKSYIITLNNKSPKKTSEKAFIFLND